MVPVEKILAFPLIENSTGNIKFLETLPVLKERLLAKYLPCPEILDMPRMEFKITGRFEDALSRQVAEAMDIFYSRDRILNSKSEYIKNCISRLTLNETEWERKERERREEADELIKKDEIEKFKKDILERQR